MSPAQWGEDHPEQFSCPRCGAGAGEDYCLPLTATYPRPTILTLHRERGAAPADLIRRGYVQYDAIVGDRVTQLWHKPGAIKCTREGVPATNG